MRGLVILLSLLTTPTVAQDLLPLSARGPVRLSGPRTGITVLSPGVASFINEASDGQLGDVPVLLQLGGQVESRAFQLESGLTGVTEAVLLVGGLNRGMVIPSATVLAGLRLPSGIEVGVGPNVVVSWGIASADDVNDAGSYARLGLAITAGISPQIDDVNLPLNVAVVRGNEGLRLSLLVGFNVSTHRY